MYPSLTGVRQDVGVRAKLAVERLAALKSREETGACVVLPVKLICRESTGCL